MENISTANTGKASAPAEPMLEMNMTPMIDVMLVLIIMFIMTLPIAQEAVNLNMAGADCAIVSCNVDKPVRVDIDFDGTVSWNGQVIDRNTLEYRFQQVGKLEKQPDVQLMANRLTLYKNVAAVMVAAQSRGVKSMGLIGGPEYL